MWRSAYKKRKGILMNKFKLLKPYVENKDVLDLGSADHGKNSKMFDFLEAHSNTCSGVDILYTANPSILQLDVEELYLEKQFDVITAMDFIEHVKNQDTFIKVVKKHLKPNGVLIIGTPNPYSLLEILGFYLNRQKVNSQHYFWHCPKTMKHILRENNMKIVKTKYYGGFFDLNYFFVIKNEENNQMA